MCVCRVRDANANAGPRTVLKRIASWLGTRMKGLTNNPELGSITKVEYPMSNLGLEEDKDGMR